jgi:hypothetical protein
MTSVSTLGQAVIVATIRPLPDAFFRLIRDYLGLSYEPSTLKGHHQDQII